MQGNSNDPVSDVKSVKVLWETFEMDGTPSTSNFISPYLEQGDDYIYLSVNSPFIEGLATGEGISTLQPSAESWSSTLDDFVSYSSASYFRAFSVKINAGFPESTSPVEDFYMSVKPNNGLNLAYELPVRCVKIQ